MCQSSVLSDGRNSSSHSSSTSGFQGQPNRESRSPSASASFLLSCSRLLSHRELLPCRDITYPQNERALLQSCPAETAILITRRTQRSRAIPTRRKQPNSFLTLLAPSSRHLKGLHRDALRKACRLCTLLVSFILDRNGDSQRGWPLATTCLVSRLRITQARP